MGQTGQMQRGPNTGYLPNQAPSNGRIPIGTTPLSDLYAASRVLDRRPRRAPDVRDLMTVVTNYNLTRSHRTILLLADGEHSVVDLARLSSKSVEEVIMLLNELETRGLIYYYDS